MYSVHTLNIPFFFRVYKRTGRPISGQRHPLTPTMPKPEDSFLIKYPHVKIKNVNFTLQFKYNLKLPPVTILKGCKKPSKLCNKLLYTLFTRKIIKKEQSDRATPLQSSTAIYSNLFARDFWRALIELSNL